MRARGAHPILGCFHSLVESQRRSPYPGLISQPDESKRAEKTLELVIHKSRVKELKRCLKLTLSQVLLGLDESKKAKKPILDLS
jgi:hypothetical protein